MNDPDCIRWWGLTACPTAAVPEVLESVDHVCSPGPEDSGPGLAFCGKTNIIVSESK